MKKLILVLLSFAFVGCVTQTVTDSKAKWKVLNSSHPLQNNAPKSNFVPSGTELVFTSNKTFNAKDNQLNIELSPVKRCSLTTNFEKEKEIKLDENAVLTVVGYRGETNDLVLSENNYHQFYLSCMSKTEQKRKTSSVKKPMPMVWKKSSVEVPDIEKMAPLFKVNYLPPQ